MQYEATFGWLFLLENEMSFCASGTSSVWLNYASIRQALEDQKTKPRVRDRSFVYAFKPNATLHRGDGDTVVLRYHHTDIVVYHPNGDKQIYTGGWTTPSTNHWLWQGARVSLYPVRPNRWSDRVWLYRNNGSPVQFEEGMRIDASGDFIGEPKPMFKMLPTKEAQAVKRRVLRTLREEYGTHLKMLETTPDWKNKIPAEQEPRDWFESMEKGEFHDHILYGLLYSMRYSRFTPQQIMRKAIDHAYQQYIDVNQAYAVLPYQPKG